MPSKILVANWKCNKNLQETEEWFEKIKDEIAEIKREIEAKAQIIIAPSFPYLQKAAELIKKYSLPFKLASQDISRFEKGSFTGEVGAFQVKDFAQFVILGHSERRSYLQENFETLKTKLNNAKKANLKIIYCTTQKDQLIDKTDYIAYEPEEAIGTGNNAPPEKVIAKKIELGVFLKPFLYGGSVNSQNIKDYLKFSEIDGFLIGGASLDPEKFLKIVKKILDH